MSQFISVLNSDLGRDYWIAIQRSSTEEGILAKKYYTPGLNWIIPRQENDRILGVKLVIDNLLQETAEATIIEVNPQIAEAMRLAFIDED
ncbi:MAG: hypothetical protein AAF551_13740 [Bacteroidota bacterium]